MLCFTLIGSRAAGVNMAAPPGVAGCIQDFFSGGGGGGGGGDSNRKCL